MARLWLLLLFLCYYDWKGKVVAIDDEETSSSGVICDNGQNDENRDDDQDRQEEEEEEEEKGEEPQDWCDVGSLHDFFFEKDHVSGIGMDNDDESDLISSYSDLPPKGSGRRQRRVCQRIAASAVTPTQLYRDYMVASRPVVLTGDGAWYDFVRNNATRNQNFFTLPELARLWGQDQTITVRYHNDNNFQGIRRFPGQGYKYVAPDHVNKTFEAFVKDFLQQEAKIIRARRQKQDPHLGLDEYLNVQSLPLYDGQTWTKLNQSLSLPPHPLGDDMARLVYQSLWVSGRGKVSQLHNDPHDNLLMVLSGTKMLYLIDPAYTLYLYPGIFPAVRNQRVAPGRYQYTHDLVPGHDNPIGHFVPVDILQPDLDRFPALQRLLDRNAIIECLLRPGDVLVLPALWWHQVHNDVDDDDGHDPDDSNLGKGDNEHGGEDCTDSTNRNNESNSNQNNNIPDINLAVNYWFEPHRHVATLRDAMLDLYAIDWVTQGPSCDKYFETMARRTRWKRNLSRGEYL